MNDISGERILGICEAYKAIGRRGRCERGT